MARANNHVDERGDCFAKTLAMTYEFEYNLLHVKIFFPP